MKLLRLSSFVHELAQRAYYKNSVFISTMYRMLTQSTRLYLQARAYGVTWRWIRRPFVPRCEVDAVDPLPHTLHKLHVGRGDASRRSGWLLGGWVVGRRPLRPCGGGYGRYTLSNDLQRWVGGLKSKAEASTWANRPNHGAEAHTTGIEILTRCSTHAACGNSSQPTKTSNASHAILQRAHEADGRRLVGLLSAVSLVHVLALQGRRHAEDLGSRCGTNSTLRAAKLCWLILRLRAPPHGHFLVGDGVCSRHHCGAQCRSSLWVTRQGGQQGWATQTSEGRDRIAYSQHASRCAEKERCLLCSHSLFHGDDHETRRSASRQTRLIARIWAAAGGSQRLAARCTTPRASPPRRQRRSTSLKNRSRRRAPGSLALPLVGLHVRKLLYDVQVVPYGDTFWWCGTVCKAVSLLCLKRSRRTLALLCCTSRLCAECGPRGFSLVPLVSKTDNR